MTESERAGARHSGAIEDFGSVVLFEAMRAPGANTAAAERTIAGLIGLLAAEGVDSAVEDALSPVPGEAARFEVIATSPDSEPETASDLDTGKALREASRIARSGDAHVTVVSLADGGIRRRVLERPSGEPFRFLFPSENTIEGPDAADAISAWDKLLHPTSPTIDDEEQQAEAQTEGDHKAAGDETPEWPGAALMVDDIVDAVRDALTDITVEVDMGAVEEMVTSAVQSALASVAELANQMRHDAAEPPPGIDMTEVGQVVTEAVESALAAAAEQSHRAQLEEPEPEPAIDMAALESTFNKALRSAIDQFSLPPVEVVAQPALRSAAPMEEAAPRTEHLVIDESSSSAIAQAALQGAAEQLEIILDAFHDRIRSGNRSLESAARELTARERTAADFTQVLSRNIEATIDRLIRHIDSRLDDLSAQKGDSTRTS